MKSLPFVLLALTVLAQWVVPLAAVRQHERVLAEGELIRLKCTAPDPHDPLRGRYLAVRPEITEAPADKELMSHRGPAYIVLDVGTDGIATVTRIERERAVSGRFVRVHVRWASNDSVHFEWPFDRYYLNEKLAPEADRWLAESLRSAKGVLAEVRVLDGRAVLADLTLDGKSFRTHLQERLKTVLPVEP
jgi:uncharacterized membrane-anchored protein